MGRPQPSSAQLVFAIVAAAVIVPLAQAAPVVITPDYYFGETWSDGATVTCTANDQEWTLQKRDDDEVDDDDSLRLDVEDSSSEDDISTVSTAMSCMRSGSVAAR
jgi:hypothetical protein